MRRLRGILRLDDFEPAARSHLPRPLFSYVSGGVEDNVSRSDNRAAFSEYGFVPRVLVGVANRSLAATLMGRTYAFPFGIAPMGISAMTAYRGDLVLASEAARAEDDRALAALQKSMKVNTVAPPELARIREKIKPVVDKYAKDVGEPLMGELNATIAKARDAK